MLLIFSRFQRRKQDDRRNSLMLTAALASLSVAGCTAEQNRLSANEATLERQEVFRQYDRLEAGLGAVYDLNGLPSPSNSPREWVRNNRVGSQADFENARRLRLRAFEELSALQAPESDAPDFSAFWEIHSAYRNAVTTVSAGHGIQSLIYTRPYVIDHVNGPHLRAMELFGQLTSADDSTNYVTLSAQLPDIVSHLEIVRRRLDLDRAAGLAPPANVLRKILADLDASPLADAGRFETWVLNWKSGVPRNTPRPTALQRFADDIASDLVPEMARLRDLISELIDDHASDEPLTSADVAFFQASIDQVTSNRMTLQSCLMTSRRLADEAQEEFWSGIRGNWYAHLPPPEEVSETDLAEDDPGFEQTDPTLPEPILPDSPLETLALWASEAPLVIPPFETEPAEPPTALPVSPEQGPVEDPVILPESFLTFQSVIERVWGDLPGFSRRRVPSLALTPILPEPVVGPRRQVPPPPPTQLPPLFERQNSQDFSQTLELNIAVDTLEATPISQHVVALLKSTFPGYDLRLHLAERREDIPALSRGLSTLAYDLGWPLTALETLLDRNAFADAPQIEAALLLDRLTVFAMAEAEAGLLSGEVSRDDAIAMLMTRLGWARTEAEAYLMLAETEPGFNCAAVEGYVTFSDLLTRSRGVLGRRFQLSGFHEALLANGSRPLELVELDVDDWISDQLQ